MKKTIAILLILVIGMVGVFAENDQKSITLQVGVEGVSNFVISDTVYTKYDDAIVAEEVDSLVGDLDYLSTGDNNLDTRLVVTYATNVLGTYTISIDSATELRHPNFANNGATIDYVMTVGTGVRNTKDPSKNKATIGSLTVTTVQGFLSLPISVVLDDNYLTAPATDEEEYYTATVVLKLSGS